MVGGGNPQAVRSFCASHMNWEWRQKMFVFKMILPSMHGYKELLNYVKFLWHEVLFTVHNAYIFLKILHETGLLSPSPPPLLPSWYKPCCKVSKFLFSRIKNFKYWSVVSLNILFKFSWEDHRNASLAWWLNIWSILKLSTWGFLSILFGFEILGLMVAYFDYQSQLTKFGIFSGACPPAKQCSLLQKYNSIQVPT